MVRPPTFSDLLARPALIAASPPPIVTLSPGSRVAAQDIAQFDARWMSANDRQQRLDEYAGLLKNRAAWIAWGVFADASAMVRMFELTDDRKYLDHLREVNNVALKYRDDQHPGDGFPLRDNPVCLNCYPPLMDHVRGKVVPAWGSGILYTDYVINGGLNPVDAVTSGVYVYGMASFARLVAEHPDPELQTAYEVDAMKFANATMETMWAFMPEWDTSPAGSYVEGTILRPRRFPTPGECTAARDRAKEHVRLFDPEGIEDLFPDIDKAMSDCERVRDYAGKPLAHNESGALVMSFIELWRALDSDFYRNSPDRASNAELTRGVIPLVVTRHQRYFFNDLRVQYDRTRGLSYAWNYNDDVPGPDVEDTSHANLDMFYVDVLRRSFDRLNAQVAPVGEPIPLDDRMMRLFANTFLHQIARPEEIDRGGNVRGRVNGEATKPDPKTGETDVNNYVLDGWVTLAAVDATVYRLCRDVSLRTGSTEGQPGSVQKYLGPSIHAALLANKRYARDVADVERSLQVAGITDDGGIWHTIRHPDRWDGFGDVKGEAGHHTGPFKAVSCAGISGEFHVCAVTDDGGMWHTIRHPDRWVGFGDVKGEAGHHTGPFKAVGCAAVNGELHVCAVTNDGSIWHTIRHPDRWDGFGDVKGEAGHHTGPFKAVGCAGISGEFHVCAVTDDGGMWHTIRHPDRWVGFGDVKGQAGHHTGPFKAVGCAAVNESSTCAPSPTTAVYGTPSVVKRVRGWASVTSKAKPETQATSKPPPAQAVLVDIAS